MDCKRIRVEEIMKLGNWLANNIIKDHVDVDTVEEFIVSGNVQQILEANSTSTSGDGDVDDGPTTWFKSNSDYMDKRDSEAFEKGMEIINYLIGSSEPMQGRKNDNAPSFYPSGKPGSETSTSGKDYKETQAYKLWQRRISDIALQLGYEFVNFLSKDEVPDESPTGEKIAEPLTEAVKNQYAFKAIFLAGGPGSGKSTVIDKLFGIPPKGKIKQNLTRAGLKVVNSDQAYEYLKAKNKIPPRDEDLTKDQQRTQGKLMARSVKIAKKQLSMYLESKIGIIIDGTGASSNVMNKKKKMIEDLGYDTYMIFVSTSLETAMERNRNRPERSLHDKIVEKSWKQVMDNLKLYKSMFGSNFVEVSTEGKQTDSLPSGVQSGISKFLSKSPKNKVAVKWLKHARELL
jgi:predicted kinase